LLAANIANADTPGYKARDIDFASVMRQTAGSSEGLRVTHARHLNANGAMAGQATAMYRIPTQPALDGNTVDVQQEQAAFAENAVRYQASLEFLSGRVRGLITAIKGQSQ
jgi:flagellar basal-body rod protein FlgB